MLSVSVRCPLARSLWPILWKATMRHLVVFGLLLTSPLGAQSGSGYCDIDGQAWVARHPEFADASPLPLDSIDLVPRLEDAPLPEYAMDAGLEALSTGWEARVDVALLIDTTGHVLIATVVRTNMRPQHGYATTSPPPGARLRSQALGWRWLAQKLFEKAATDMLAASRFTPGERAGQRVRVLICLPVDFSDWVADR